MQGLREYELFNSEVSEDAPAWAIAEIVSFDPTEGYIVIRRPTFESLSEVMIVNGGGIKAGKRGVGFSPFDGSALLIRYLQSDGLPGAGENWGTESGSWELNKDKLGFISIDCGTLAVSIASLFNVRLCNVP